MIYINIFNISVGKVSLKKKIKNRLTSYKKTKILYSDDN